MDKFCGVQILFLSAALVYVLKSLDEASLVFFFLATFSNVPLLLAALSCCQDGVGPECDVVLGSFSLKLHSETHSSRGSTWTSSATCRGFCSSSRTSEHNPALLDASRLSPYPLVSSERRTLRQVRWRRTCSSDGDVAAAA